MNKLQLMKNDYIQKRSLKISKVITSRTIDIPTSYVYGQKLAFDLGQVRQHNGLYQMFIKVSDIVFDNLTVAPLDFTIEDYLAFLIKNVTLRTKKGTTLMHYDYLYTLKRMYDASETMVGNVYDDMCLLNQDTTNGLIPLFMFFDAENPLDLRTMEQLELVVEINDLSGVDNDFELESCRFDLLCMFNDTPANTDVLNLGDLSLYGSTESITQGHRLSNTFDVFYEPDHSMSGVTRARIRLECPYPVISMHILAQDSIFDFSAIRSVKLESANEVIFECDTRVMLLEKPSVEGTFINIPFRQNNGSGLLDFSNSFYPAYLELTFDAAFTGDISVFYEYVSDLKVIKSDVVRTETGVFKIR